METQTETKIEEKPAVVLEAVQAAERLEKANAEMRELIKQAEKLEAFKALGGRTEGARQAEKPKEINPADYARNALRGNLS